MALDIDQAADLLATTLRDLPQDEFEVMWDSQHFEFSRIYSQQSRRIDGGTSIKRNVILDETGTAEYRRLYDVDQPSVDQVHNEIDVPWTQIGTNYSWDIFELMLQRNSAKGYIDLLRSRRVERLWGFAEKLEERGWLTPTNATDRLFPFGVPFYINKADIGVTSNGDFIGQTVRFQDGSTSTIVAGIDGALEAKWRNFAATYTKIDNQFLRRLRRLFMLTKFTPPVFINNPPGNDARGPNVRIYAAQDEVIELQDLGDKRDDNSTPQDLAGKMLVNVEGTTWFNRAPIVYIPQLDTDADNPVYVVDWSKLQPIVHDGYWMVESKPMTDRGQHTTVTIFVDGAHQNLCINRRSVGGVLHNVTTA